MVDSSGSNAVDVCVLSSSVAGLVREQVLTTTVETESSSDRHKDEGRGSEATRGSAHHSGTMAVSFSRLYPEGI